MSVLLLFAFVERNVVYVVLPELIEAKDFLIRKRTLHTCRYSHHQRTGRDNCAGRDQRTGRNQRLRTDACIIQHDRTNADQGAVFDVATVQRHAVAHCHFVFENGWM